MDEECVSDALLADVVSKAKAARQAICSQYRDPEEAWLDGFLEGWFEGHFRTFASEPVSDPLYIVNRTKANR